MLSIGSLGKTIKITQTLQPDEVLEGILRKIYTRPEIGEALPTEYPGATHRAYTPGQKIIEVEVTVSEQNKDYLVLTRKQGLEKVTIENEVFAVQAIQTIQQNHGKRAVPVTVAIITLISKQTVEGDLTIEGQDGVYLGIDFTDVFRVPNSPVLIDVGLDTGDTILGIAGRPAKITFSVPTKIVAPVGSLGYWDLIEMWALRVFLSQVYYFDGVTQKSDVLIITSPVLMTMKMEKTSFPSAEGGDDITTFTVGGTVCNFVHEQRVS